MWDQESETAGLVEGTRGRSRPSAKWSQLEQIQVDFTHSLHA